MNSPRRLKKKKELNGQRYEDYHSIPNLKAMLKKQIREIEKLIRKLEGKSK